MGARRAHFRYYRGGVVEAAVRDFGLQWHDGNAWKEVADAIIRDHRQADWSGTFAAIEPTRLRLCITSTQAAQDLIMRPKAGVFPT